MGVYFSLLFFGGWGICSPCSTAQLQWFWTLAAQCALLPHPHSQLSLEHNLLFTMEVRYCSRRMPSRKLFSVLNGPGLTTTMLWCFFSPLFWNQVLHGGRSAKISSTYKVAYVWCLNLCEISLSLSLSLQVICKDCTTFKEIIACSLCRMHYHQGIRGWQGVFQLEHINLLGVVSPPTTCLLVCLRFMLTLL